MKVGVCTPEVFWERMCDIRFVRESDFTGRILDTRYVTTVMPEQTLIIENAVSEIQDALNGKSITTQILEAIRRCCDRCCGRRSGERDQQSSVEWPDVD